MDHRRSNVDGERLSDAHKIGRIVQHIGRIVQRLDHREALSLVLVNEKGRFMNKNEQETSDRRDGGTVSRRDFVTHAALIGTGLAVAPLLACAARWPCCSRSVHMTSRIDGSSSQTTMVRPEGDGSGTRAWRGIVNRNRLPFPRVLTAWISPPCWRTMLLQIASPSPLPPFSRESDASTC